MLSQINFGLGNAAAVFMFLCAFLASLTFAFVLRRRPRRGSPSRAAKRRRQGRNRRRSREFRARDTRLGDCGSFPGSARLGVLGERRPRAGVRRRCHGTVTAVVPHGPYGYALNGGSGKQRHHSREHGGSDARPGLPAAYALARFGLPFSNGLLGVMLAIAFFPPVALLVPCSCSSGRAVSSAPS